MCNELRSISLSITQQRYIIFIRLSILLKLKNIKYFYLEKF